MEMITTTSGLEKACATLSKASFITVDTEFMRDSTYWPILWPAPAPVTITARRPGRCSSSAITWRYSVCIVPVHALWRCGRCSHTVATRSSTAQRIAEDHYRVFAGVAAIARDLAWFRRHAEAFDVRLSDTTETYAQIALMGPDAARIVAASQAPSLDTPP